MAKQHKREGFACGEPALDDFLARYARQQQDKGFSKTYVALDGDRVLGFVAISAGQVATEVFPSGLRLPRYPIPVMRIGRLAVDQQAQGQGVGQDLLAYALRTALELSDRIGLYAVVVDAKHDKARDFYQRLGFTAFTDTPLSLYLSLATLRRS